MASDDGRAGVAGSRAAENLRAIRTQRGLSTYALSARLAAVGWPVAQSTLTRIERGQRALTVADLLALAVVLDCSPNRLLLPPPGENTDADVPVINDATRAPVGAVWAWAVGERPLVLDGAPEPTGQAEALFQVENQPHHFGRDQAMSWQMFTEYPQLRQLVRDALAQGMSAAQVAEVFARIVNLEAGEDGG